jgi:hypothetical protein
MTKSYEERMAEKYNFLKKDEDINKTQPTIKKNKDKDDVISSENIEDKNDK